MRVGGSGQEEKQGDQGGGYCCDPSSQVRMWLLSVPLYSTSYRLEDAVSPVIKWELLATYLWNYYKSHY